MLPVLALQPLSELPLFIRLCPSPSLAALFSPSVSQQVAHISSPVLFTLIGQPIDRPSAGASMQLRQLHEVDHSISRRISHSFIKSLSIEWDFYVWFILFCQSIQLHLVRPQIKSKNKNCKAFIYYSFERIIINNMPVSPLDPKINTENVPCFLQ